MFRNRRDGIRGRGGVTCPQDRSIPGLHIQGRRRCSMFVAFRSRRLDGGARGPDRGSYRPRREHFQKLRDFRRGSSFAANQRPSGSERGGVVLRVLKKRGRFLFVCRFRNFILLLIGRRRTHGAQFCSKGTSRPLIVRPRSAYVKGKQGSPRSPGELRNRKAKARSGATGDQE